MIGLAFSTNAFKKNTLEEAIDAIADAGYTGVELMADVPHAHPDSMDAGRIAQIQKRIANRRLSVSNINAFTLFAKGDTYHPTWIEDDADRRDLRIEHTIQCVELAAKMSTGTVSLQPGGPLIGSKTSRAEAGRRFADGLRQVLPTAKKFNVILAIEPEPGLFIETSTEYLEFKNEYFRAEPLVKMNCDIGHLFCVGEDPAEVIRAMPEHVAHVHLEDIGKNCVHQHLAPGKGAIDFAAVLAALDGVGYKGWVTVELYPYETTAANVAKNAFEYLKPLLKRK
jgi:sugar phosphate isomerase/epimerase